MKKRNLNQKLNLSKSTISSLKLKSVNGGGGTFFGTGTQESDCLCELTRGQISCIDGDPRCEV
ncbi:hypothetical protein GTQ40_14730 [Flavobacteriaceae bacterium R38]|nr:hypothetical protein [Flavobacteriaceae bacterium R38]